MAIKANARQIIIRMLWEKQFEKSPWHDKFYLIHPDSLEADYGKLADEIIEAILVKQESDPGSDFEIGYRDPKPPIGPSASPLLDRIDTLETRLAAAEANLKWTEADLKWTEEQLANCIRGSE